MKFIPTFLALCVLSIPAYAVTVTITVGPKTFTTMITAGNATRFQNWAAAAYPTIPNPAFTPSCGCPATITNPDPTMSALTAIWTGMVNNVINFERAQAKAAVPEPAPVN